MLPVAILAGGLATRLGPLTKQIPKSLIPIHGEPFVAHQLRLLQRSGVRHVILCVGHLGKMIEQAIGDGNAFNVKVEYSYDGPTLLGTAGAVKAALPRLGEQFFVMYGDSYLTCDYAAIEQEFLQRSRLGLMTVFRNDGQWDASNVEFENNRIVAYSKKNRTARMRYIDYGLGVFRAPAFVRTRATDLADVYAELLQAGELTAVEVRERFYEIGSPAGLKEMTTFLSPRRRPAEMSTRGLDQDKFAKVFLAEAAEIIARLDVAAIEKAAGLLASTRAAGGRLFILGVGGSAANASHAVNDFRKIAGIEAYAPTDNVAELTARANDEGWASIFDGWLRTSRLRSDDLLLILSVGGGNVEQNVSPNLVAALKYAKSVGAKIIGVVGRDGGYTATVADACVLIPTVNPAHITPHAEAFQAVVWHLLVSHPAVKMQSTKWESMASSGSGRAVFLDRDGVINKTFVRDGKPFPPSTLRELEVLPGVLEALHELKQHGYKLLVVTNQPDVARGTQSQKMIDAMHRALSAQLPIDDIFVCYHTDQDKCDCRKPLPGMLLAGARKHNIDLAASFMVGDRWRDIEAGYNAGCKTILIEYGYSERLPDHAPDLRVGSLREAADWIIRSAPKGAHPQ